jgi:hypothetical protein
VGAERGVGGHEPLFERQSAREVDQRARERGDGQIVDGDDLVGPERRRVQVQNTAGTGAWPPIAGDVDACGRLAR